MNYIYQKISFHRPRIDFPHAAWKKTNLVFEKVDKSQVIQIEKEMISLDLHSFKRIEDYMDCVKDSQSKLGECWKNFLKKDGYLIELVFVNIRTPYDVLYSS